MRTVSSGPTRPENPWPAALSPIRFNVTGRLARSADRTA